ncbi:SIS domain-containing protein [Deinococcus radiotolerans]|uniref:Fructosamine deglycase FrlB n=1 Tax=Deinococcus radiotolerans TaxID=1309407 RepID=A0ABQ2FRF7_9DEIO|nr:SIS domain-containing protein [Deinococcus radiotolerans]GGL19500.1 fructosamine deglycase FrlB [Deinococcus radiotolerans]
MTLTDTRPPVQATPIDRDLIVSSLQGALQAKNAAAHLGRNLAHQIDRIYFVACGAPNRVMLGLEYWLDQAQTDLQVKRYFPAEFLALAPRLDERTLVVLASKSGTTQETVEAAQFLRDQPCRTLVVTTTADKPLAQGADHLFLMGETEQAHTGIYIVLQGFLAGLLDGRQGYSLHDAVLRSLDALPDVLVESAELSDARGQADAHTYKDDHTLYHLASGPVFTTAYVFGVCMLMEMQWLHSVPFEAAEWFHGPFEILDAQTPVMILLGEDPSRPQAERALTFCQKYTDRLMVYDARDLPMTGVDPEVRALFAPYALQAALNRFAEHLAAQRNHSLDTRRYMWVTDY